MHEPAVVTALVSDNDGNGRGSLLGGDVKAGRVLWQIAIKIPANADVTKLERSGDAATHNEGTYSAVNGGGSKLFINPRFAQFESVFFGLFLRLESYSGGFDSFNFCCLLQVAIKNQSS
jgi:hypothetical protein